MYIVNILVTLLVIDSCDVCENRNFNLTLQFQVYHLTVGEDVINPVLHFIVAKTDSGKLIGFMSASVEE